MLSIPPSVKLWFAGGVDLRLGFDGLAGLVRTQLNGDPMSGHLFVFTNRSANRLEVPYWGGHGLCLWCSRLEDGRYHFPEAAGIELTVAQLFGLGDKPTAEQLLDWLPDRWLLNRTRSQPIREVNAR